MDVPIVAADHDFNRITVPCVEISVVNCMLITTVVIFPSCTAFARQLCQQLRKVTYLNKYNIVFVRQMVLYGVVLKNRSRLLLSVNERFTSITSLNFLLMETLLGDI